MGTDYNAGIDMGFVFQRDNLLVKYEKEIPAKFHMEDRFDSKTGKKLPQVKVIDEAEYTVFEFNGKTYEEDEELFRAIAQATKCVYSVFGSGSLGGSDYVLFGLSGEARNNYGVDAGNVQMGGEIDVNTVVRYAPRLEKLRDRLRKLGLKPRQAEVVVTHDIG